MSKIIDSIQAYLRLRRAQKAVDNCTKPETIMVLTSELRDLVARAAQFSPPEAGMGPRLKLLENELTRLEELTTRPEFCTLSTEQRLEVRQGLLQVRDQVLKTMQQGSPPTEFVQ